MVTDFEADYTGQFCISLNRINSPPKATLMGCNSSQEDLLLCESAIETFKYHAQANALAEVVITPTSGLFRPKVWICSPGWHHNSQRLYHRPFHGRFHYRSTSTASQVFLCDRG